MKKVFLQNILERRLSERLLSEVSNISGPVFFLSTTCTVHENAWKKLWPDLEGEKDFNDDHEEENTDFVQSIPGFQERDEDIETWMACNAEDCGFQMLNDDKFVICVKEESDLSTIKWMKTRATTTMKVARIPQILKRFLRYKRLWSSTNNNRSAVLFNYCCSRESETLQRENKNVQWYSEK
ncbi:uncharacterized protein TNCV_3015051 [Trichonephila clavipes]|nr:uncharacterized protein TNCV_3015051 [Trichonephila clavipes]